MRYRPTDKAAPEDVFEWFLLMILLCFSPAMDAIVEPILGDPYPETWKD